MNFAHYRRIAILNPICGELARALPPRVLSFIQSREGTETTIIKLFAEIRDILACGGPKPGGSDPVVKAFPPPRDELESLGAISLTMDGMSWTLANYRYVTDFVLPPLNGQPV